MKEIKKKKDKTRIKIENWERKENQEKQNKKKKEIKKKTTEREKKKKIRFKFGISEKLYKGCPWKKILREFLIKWTQI